MTGVAPRLSVIVATTAPLREASPALGPLLREARARPLQLLVATCADGAPLPSWAGARPEVTVVRLPSATTLPALLAAAIREAQGDLIGILDARCEVDDGWVPAVLAAHQGADPVIGGAVDPAGLHGPVAWAAYFSDYGRFMRPVVRGGTPHVPGINLTFKRSALAHGREYVEGEFWKSYWCRRLQAAGFELVVDPSMVVYYRRTSGVRGFLLERFHHGRCFAAMRRRELTPAGRVVFVVGALALPLLFCVRIIGAVLPKRRHLGALVRAFPVIVLGTVAWALGEFCGYSAGGGGSCRYVR
jgi:glycosyl transferase family 2